MFYNGFIILLSISCTLIYLWHYLQTLFTYELLPRLTRACETDSLISLYLLASPVYTLIILLWMYVLLYLRFTRIQANMTWAILVLFVTYFLDTVGQQTFVSNVFGTVVVNSNLQNGLLNIHPIMIYYSYGLILYVWWCMYNRTTNFLPSIHWSSILLSNLYITMIAIILGALWAAQELNWGGFWSWDPVELVSLSLLYYLVRIFHHRSSIYLNFYKISGILVGLILIILVIRFGAITTIHSFVRTNQNILYIHVSMFFVICVAMRLFIEVGVMVRLNRKYSLLSQQGVYRIMYNVLLISLIGYLTYLILITIFYSLRNLGFNIRILSLYILGVIILSDLYNSICTWFRANFKVSFYAVLALIIIVLKIQFFILVYAVVLYILASRIMVSAKFLHTTLLICYIIGVFFFHKVSVYTVGIHTNTNMYISAQSVSNVSIDFYETNFFLKKTICLDHIKTELTHVSGFNIITNTFISFYNFSKNKVSSFLFCEELVFTIILGLMCNSFLYMYLVRTRLYLTIY